MSAWGDVVLVALSGDYGKPRPAIVVQSDDFDALPSVVVCPTTTTLRPELAELRPTLVPNSKNGLFETSQVMSDKPISVPRAKVRRTIGRLDEDSMAYIGRVLAAILKLP